MHRILVVDDVPIIVEGLAELLQDEETLDLEIYKAYSGIEAIEVLKMNRIDIVLSDIKMPHLEGIALFEIIKEQWPNCKVIFLTSFNDFNYVQSALSLGAFDYILKTEEQSKIIRVVSKAIEAIEEQFASEYLIEKAQQYMQLAIPSLQRQFLLSLLEGKEKSRSRIDPYFEDMRIPLKSAFPVYLLVARIDSWRAVSIRPDQESLLYAVQNIVEECLGERVLLTAVIYERSKIVWFIQPRQVQGGPIEDEEWERVFYLIKGMLETVQDVCSSLLKLPISFVFGNAPCDWTVISERFDQLITLLAKKIGLQSEVLLIEGSGKEMIDKVEPSDKVAGFSLQRKVNLLGYHLENGEEQAFTAILEELRSIFMDDDVHDFLKMEVYHSISSLMMSYMNRYELTSKVIKHVAPDKLLDTETIISWTDLSDYFQELAQYIFRCKENELDENVHMIVSKVREYIQTNMDKSISLTELAQQVHLNPSYLSRLYKSITGYGITEYTASLRNEKAKKLLKETNMKIQDISNAVGYQSGVAFIRFFKKYNDITPQEYRNGN